MGVIQKTNQLITIRLIVFLSHLLPLAFELPCLVVVAACQGLFCFRMFPNLVGRVRFTTHSHTLGTSVPRKSLCLSPMCLPLYGLGCGHHELARRLITYTWGARDRQTYSSICGRPQCVCVFGPSQMGGQIDVVGHVK